MGIGAARPAGGGGGLNFPSKVMLGVVALFAVFLIVRSVYEQLKNSRDQDGTETPGPPIETGTASNLNTTLDGKSEIQSRHEAELKLLPQQRIDGTVKRGTDPIP